MNKLVKTSYSKEDVIVLLKDLSGQMVEMSAAEREKAIQSGKHYSTMLPEEKAPSDRYEKLFKQALRNNKNTVARDIAAVAEYIVAKTFKCNGKEPVIISLARAGIPVGILIKRYIKIKYNISCPHYAISIIRDKGIDVNAMNYIYDEEVGKHFNNIENFLFVDGWTGKGAIKTQLEEAVAELKLNNTKWSKLSSDLYVLADPANITPYCGTHADYLLPSACLNSTVSGLTSRTILNDLIDTDKDFHGAVYFKKFEDIDYSNEFIDTITNEFKYLFGFNRIDENNIDKNIATGMEVVNNICSKFNIKDYKKVKPGIGETTRVLLRRVPWKVLLNTNVSEDDKDIRHIVLLCKTKNIPIERYELGNYKVCGLIKDLSADA